MKFPQLFCAAAFLAAAAGARAETSSSGKPANVLNPNISVIGDFVTGAGPRSDAASNRASLREAEVAFQANVDPYARADFFLSIPDGGSLEVEEGYVTLVSLPWGLAARGGKFKAAFGRMNQIHGHERPQVDDPFVVGQFLGEEGVRDAGVEVSRIFAPFGLFTEVTYAALNGLGEEDAPETQTVTVTGTDADGNAVMAPVDVHQDAADHPRTARNFAQVARVRFYGDLTDAANVDCGVSGLLHEPEGDKQVRMAAADLTFRWRPPQSGLYRGLMWRTEAMYSDRTLTEERDLAGAVTAPRRRLNRRGAYSYVEAQASRRWRFGLRGDYSEDPEGAGESFVLPDGTTRQVRRSVSRGLSPTATFNLSEFNRLRFEVQRKIVPSGEIENRAWLQWTIVLGPHGAHPF